MQYLRPLLQSLKMGYFWLFFEKKVPPSTGVVVKNMSYNVNLMKTLTLPPLLVQWRKVGVVLDIFTTILRHHIFWSASKYGGNFAIFWPNFRVRVYYPHFSTFSPFLRFETRGWVVEGFRVLGLVKKKKKKESWCSLFFKH